MSFALFKLAVFNGLAGVFTGRFVQNSADQSLSPLQNLEVDGNIVSTANGITVPVAIGQTATDGSTSITAGGTAQNLFGGAVPVNGWKVANPHPTEDLWVNDNGQAAAPNTGYRVFANGGQYGTEPGEKPVGIISVYGQTTGHVFNARRW